MRLAFVSTSFVLDSRLNSDADCCISKFVMCTIPGIISLCRPDGKGVQSLLGVFCLPNSDVRVRPYL